MKKIIAFVLAVVMVLGLAVTASAAYSDQKQITQTEAADILDYLGIMTGNAGKFEPKQILNREQASKLIAIFHNGSAQLTVDEKIGHPFADLDETGWSVKFITYCYQNGLVNGTSKNTYEPKKQLNGYAFLKMVLNVMGYDTKIEGFTGGEWASNVANVAQKADLTNGIPGFNGKAPLSRENAARIMLNALKGYAVTYVNGKTVAGDTIIADRWDLHIVNSTDYTDIDGRPGHKWYTNSTGTQVGGVYPGSAPNFVLYGKVTFHDMLVKLGVDDANNSWVAFSIGSNVRDMCHFGENHSGCGEAITTSGAAEVYYVGTTHISKDYVDCDMPLYRVVITK